MVWISICGLGVDMGSDDGESDEAPAHRVEMPDLRVLETEVTAAQYAACVADGICAMALTGDVCNSGDPLYADHPINCVTWDQAVAFCQWAGGRLPSEAEWEFAARGGGRDIDYPWGDEAPECHRAAMNDGLDCFTGRTWAVCSKEAGKTYQGLCDMAGNVWEWVQDWYHPDYEDDYFGPPTDGSAWEIPPGTSRVRRGGSFVGGEFYLRCTRRGSDAPNYSGYNLGFRCAK